VLDASECPPTFSTPPEMIVGIIAGGDSALRRAAEEVEDRPEAGSADIERLGLSDRDVVVGIAASGRTPYVLGAVRAASQRGAMTIGITCNRATPLEVLVDLAITPIVGPEIIAGSTRLKAGTATKMVLNMLSTGAMVLLGKTYGNLMVDLRATNAKLRDRSLRIVQTVTGLETQEAFVHLHAADGEVKTAIVTALTGLTPGEARKRLKEHGGRIRPILTPSAGS
jgi:N-acetylmuramic acid 6-phosphate etherase